MSLVAWMPHHGGGVFERELRARLGPDVDLRTGSDPPDPPLHRVLVAGRPSGGQLEASPRLESVIIPWAGVPPQTRECLAARPGVSLHVLHHNAAPTAELAVTLLLAAAKRVVPIDRRLRAGDWRPRFEGGPATGLLLEGRTAVVLGFGSIGRRVARSLHALGMEVKATRRRASAMEVSDGIEVHPAGSTAELLATADAVACCLPATAETDGLLDRAMLARVGPGAVLVNVGRGGIVEEEALWDALEDGRVAAAGLDVWWRYPESEDARASTPPGRFEWGAREDVVLSPHRAGDSDRTEALRAEHLARSLDAAARGDAIPHRVDLHAGY